MNRTSSRPSRRCSISIAAARVSASKRCRTPFGSPVVPDVNSSWAIASGFGARAAIASGSAFSCSRRRREVVPLHAGARQQVDVLAGARHEHVLDGERPLLVGEQRRCGLGRWSRPRKRSGRPARAPSSGAARRPPRARGRSASAGSTRRRSSCARASGRRTRPSSAAGRRRSRPAARRARSSSVAGRSAASSSSLQVHARVPSARTSTIAVSVGRSRAQRATHSTIGISAAWSIATDSTARCSPRLAGAAGGALAGARGRPPLRSMPDRRHVVEEARDRRSGRRWGRSGVLAPLRARRRDGERHLRRGGR